MDLTIVAVYVICDDLCRSDDHRTRCGEWQSVTTFGFHARVSIKVKYGVGRSQVNIATFMVSKHI